MNKELEACQKYIALMEARATRIYDHHQKEMDCAREYIDYMHELVFRLGQKLPHGEAHKEAKRLREEQGQ